MAYRVLIVDDEENSRMGVQEVLEEKGFEARTADGVQSATELLHSWVPDIVVTDLRMSHENDGLDLLVRIKRGPYPETAVIIMTAYGDIDTAVSAMKLGAVDFFTKPFSAQEIEVRLAKVVQSLDSARANSGLRRQLADRHTIVGNSRAINDLKRRIARVAKTDARVLITGPHGSGKDLVAWAIQRGSEREDKPFIPVNCAAIAETLIEAELFGVEKGAFTGAVEKKIGRFQQADHGTIFLDEVGDMSLAAQAKVLRVIEAGEVSPVGSTRTFNVNVRVIAATNKDLEAMMARGDFREDLFHRLNTVVIAVPPLSEHREDIPLLVNHFLRILGKSCTVEEVFTPQALDRLQSWHWPGNVRELRNVIERTFIFNSGEMIRPGDIDFIRTSRAAANMTAPETETSKTLRDARSAWERQYIERMLGECASVTEAAKRMGLKRSYLYQKMNELGIETKLAVGQGNTD
jgi:two-component system nitrogen regulation response regulator NtrX